MNSSAVAGLLWALGATHAVVAAYAFLVFLRTVSLGKRASKSAADDRNSGALHIFALLNLTLAVCDGSLARIHSRGLRDPGLVGSVVVVEVAAGLVPALLFHFVLSYANVARRKVAALGAYVVMGGAVAATLDAVVGRARDATIQTLSLAGLSVPVLRVPMAKLGIGMAILSVTAVGIALIVLGSAFIRGRREATAFMGLLMVTASVLGDAIWSGDCALVPTFSPIGYAFFVHAIIGILLVRFSSLRGQLEERAKDLKHRARKLAKSYEDLRRAQGELVRKEQLAAMGELSAVVAHEVRNPLAIICNAVATLRRAELREEDRGTLLRILDEESSRLNHLVGDLLRYARPVSLERQLISVRELVERGLSLVQGRSDVVTELVEEEPVERIWADSNLIRQVIENLIDNAAQAMPAGGVLTLTLRNRDHEAVRGVELLIQDTGEGMDTQVRKRALDPFFTTRPSGTGLGLAIVARIVDAHGGMLRIRSKAGAGTAVHVFLPRSSESAHGRGGAGDAEGRASPEPPLPRELRRAIARRDWYEP